MKTKLTILIAAVSAAFIAGQVSQHLRNPNPVQLYRIDSLATSTPDPSATPEGPSMPQAHKRILPLPPGVEEHAVAQYEASQANDK